MRSWKLLGTMVILGVMLASCAGVAATGTKPGLAQDYRDPARLADLLSGRSEPYLLVDVRTAGEYSAGHVPTAINIPYDVIASRPPTPDTGALIIVYCASGHRSGIAAAALRGLGYTRVVDFGPVSRWKGPLRQGADPGDCPCR